MSRFPIRFAAVVIPAALGLAVASVSISSTASADTQSPSWGRGMGGPYGGSMWGRGFGPGRGMASATRMGPGWYQAEAAWGDTPAGNVWPGAYLADANKDGTLTVDEVKSFVEARHAARGFNDLKVGTVKEQGDDAIVAEIVNTGGDVVRTLIFPKKIDRAAFERAERSRFAYGPGMRGSRRGFDDRDRAWGRGMHGGFGPGMRANYGPGMGYGYRPGMQGNYGPGMRGAYGPRMGANYGSRWGYRAAAADHPVTVDDVKSIVERRLAMWNNPNVKLGNVTEGENDSITAEIVTKDGSLVEALKFDRKTGRASPVR